MNMSKRIARFMVVAVVLCALAGSGAAIDMDIVDTDNIIGAYINEENVQHTLHVSLEGNDSNPGTLSAPYRTINKAAEVAFANQLNYEGTKVVIHPGTYREMVDALTAEPDIEAGLSAPIIFEPSQRHSVIISGSDILTGWSAIGGDVYSHSWTEDWGLWVDISGLAGYELTHFQNNPILRRREMFFADGEHLRQYLSYSQCAAQENSFYVDETADLVYVHLQPGSVIGDMTIEAAKRMYVFEVHGKRSIVVKGLIFEHATNVISQGGSHDGQKGAVSFEICEDILLEDNIIRWNNGSGWSVMGFSDDSAPQKYYPCERVTFRGNASNYNGIEGGRTRWLRNAKFLDEDVSYNNWRGEWGVLWSGWTGTRFHHSHSIIISGLKSVGSYARGLWVGSDCANVLIEDSYLCGNVDGLKFEIAHGPILVKNCVISDNSEWGVLYQISNYVRIENCRIENNGDVAIWATQPPASLCGYVWDWEYKWLPAGITICVGRLTVENCIIGGSGSSKLVDFPDDTFFKDTLDSNNNYWYHDQSDVFQAGSTNYNFAGWQSYSGQDGDSTFNTNAPIPSFCGDFGTQYLAGDIDNMCSVDVFDFADLSDKWLTDTTDGVTADRTYAIEPWYDTTVDSLTANSNHAGDDESLGLVIWNGSGQEKNALMYFDVSSIDSSATVVDANLYIFVYNYNHNGNPDVTGMTHGWKFHRMLVPWSDSSTYNSLNTLRPGIEYDATEFASYLHNEGDTGLGQKHIIGFGTAVANWVDGTWDNYGFMIKAYDPPSSWFNSVSWRTQEYDDYRNGQEPILYVRVQTDAACYDPEVSSNEDLNNDCTINMDDFAILANDWLESSL
jgi:parallel beta-helix repeat protein